MNSVLVIYRITRKFPKEKRYGLIPQIKRSAVSEPSNIVKIIRKKTFDPLNSRILESLSASDRFVCLVSRIFYQ